MNAANIVLFLLLFIHYFFDEQQRGKLIIECKKIKTFLFSIVFNLLQYFLSLIKKLKGLITERKRQSRLYCWKKGGNY